MVPALHTCKYIDKCTCTISKKLKTSKFISQGSVKQMLNLSQQEFVRRIEQFNQVSISDFLLQFCCGYY